MLDGCLEEEHATMLKDLSPMVTRLLKMPNMIQPHLRYFSPAATGFCTHQLIYVVSGFISNKHVLRNEKLIICDFLSMVPHCTPLQ